MKTLDEVIFLAPYTPTPWGADALHYLKEYQKNRLMYENEFLRSLSLSQMYPIDKERLDKILEEYRKSQDKADNQPLAWNELLEMEEKAVWIETKDYKAWYLIYEISNSTEEIHLVGLYGTNVLHKNEHGTSWQAYRKE